MQSNDIIREKQFETLVRLIQNKAENLFVTRQLTCSEAVLSVLNTGLDGGLAPEMAIRLGSGLPEGIGGSGCTCGALTGGVIALGLFMGRNTPGVLNGKRIGFVSRNLHDQFKARFKSTCCRVLTKHLQRGSRDHFDTCGKCTGWVAARTAELILETKPELLFRADRSYLETLDSPAIAQWKKIAGHIRG